jgi:ElaB/YqjD/DUF883 family membrane-anchored ribosome-binding protein
MTTTESNPRIKGGLSAVVEDGEDELKATAGQGSERVSELRARLSAALDATKDAAQRLEERTLAAAKATDRCIREHPYETIGVAFGLGLLIGVLAARRKA